MRNQLNRNTRLLLCLLLGVSCSVGFLQSALVFAAEKETTDRVDAVHVQRIVDDLKGRLGIPQAVTVTVVDRNPLMVSVAPASDGGFALSLEADFAERLTQDELTAAVAHELGHVWIYTHFPYLQTEQLANEIAMRVVSRESLVPVYAHMFERARVDGDLTQYLGNAHPADH
jgi:predicted Zn-dependent protease